MGIGQVKADPSCVDARAVFALMRRRGGVSTGRAARGDASPALVMASASPDASGGTPREVVRTETEPSTRARC